MKNILLDFIKKCVSVLNRQIKTIDIQIIDLCNLLYCIFIYKYHFSLITVGFIQGRFGTISIIDYIIYYVIQLFIGDGCWIISGIVHSFKQKEYSLYHSNIFIYIWNFVWDGIYILSRMV